MHFLPKWKFVVTLYQASLSKPFSQQHCSLHVCVSHLAILPSILNTSKIILYPNKENYNSLALMMVNIFLTNKVFFKLSTVFRHDNYPVNSLPCIIKPWLLCSLIKKNIWFTKYSNFAEVINMTISLKVCLGNADLFHLISATFRLLLYACWALVVCTSKICWHVWTLLSFARIKLYSLITFLSSWNWLQGFTSKSQKERKRKPCTLHKFGTNYWQFY